MEDVQGKPFRQRFYLLFTETLLQPASSHSIRQKIVTFVFVLFSFRSIDQPFILPEEYDSVLESWL